MYYETNRALRKAKAFGIHARSAIHPMQIECIYVALKSSYAVLEYTKSVMEAFENLIAR